MENGIIEQFKSEDFFWSNSLYSTLMKKLELIISDY